ncbi:hypothetical protein HOY80DRAFT_883858, partial [Tuber brumale]
RNSNRRSRIPRVRKADSREIWNEILIMAIVEVMRCFPGCLECNGAQTGTLGDDVCAPAIIGRRDYNCILILNGSSNNQKRVPGIQHRGLDPIVYELAKVNRL